MMPGTLTASLALIIIIIIIIIIFETDIYSVQCIVFVEHILS
jgi:hypothetical protein